MRIGTISKHHETTAVMLPDIPFYGEMLQQSRAKLDSSNPN